MKTCYFCKGEVVKKGIQHVHQWGEKFVLCSKFRRQLKKLHPEVRARVEEIEELQLAQRCVLTSDVRSIHGRHE